MGVIQRQGSKQSIVKLAGVMIGFISILLIYPLDLEAYGYAQFLYSASLLIIPIMGMGVSQSAVKFFAEYQGVQGQKPDFLWTILLLHVLPFLIFIFLFFIFRESFYDLLSVIDFNVNLFRANEWTILCLATLLMLYNSVSLYISNYGRIVIPTVINELGYKVFLPAVVLALYLGYIARDHIAIFLIGFFVVALLSLLAYARYLNVVKGFFTIQFLTRERVLRIAKYCLYSALSGLGVILAYRIDAVMVTGLLGESKCGLYLTLLTMAMVIDIPNQAIGKIAGPIISKSWTEGDHNEIQNIYSKASLNSLIIGILIFMCIWFNLESIFALSSRPEEFIGTSQIFLFLAIAKLIDAMTGINTHILIYSDYYKYNLWFLLILGLCNIGFNIYLIDVYGLLGAAIATLLSLTLYNVIKYFFIRNVMKMGPFSWRTGLVLLISAAVFILIDLVPTPSSIIGTILIRSILIVTLFGPAIYFSKASVDFNSLVDKYFKLFLPNV